MKRRTARTLSKVWWLRAAARSVAAGPDAGAGAASEIAAPPEVSAEDLRMMTRALDLADRAAVHGEVPVGAVVYRVAQGRGEILGEGFNLRERDADPSAHAELLAIREACRNLGDWRLEGCTLAVTLEPCPMCAGAIVNARVPRVLYGADDPKAGAVRTLFTLLSDPRLNHRAQVVPGVMREAAAERLRSFFKALRARKSR